MTLIKSKTKERSNQATAMKGNTTNKSLEKQMITENPETSRGKLVILVGYVQKPHTPTFLDAQIFKSTFQVNQKDHLAFLKKSAQNA